MALYEVIKRYGHEQGLSSVFKQFRAPETHCSKFHGYALAFEFCFEGDVLDHRNWLISFGELKDLLQWLKDTFDHKTLVSVNDPDLGKIIDLERDNILDAVVVSEVGCEAFARMAYQYVVTKILSKSDYIDRDVRLKYVQVQEHGGNTVRYNRPRSSEDLLKYLSFSREEDPYCPGIVPRCAPSIFLDGVPETIRFGSPDQTKYVTSPVNIEAYNGPCQMLYLPYIGVNRLDDRS